MDSILKKARELSILKTSQNLPEYKRFLFKIILNSKSKITGIYGARGVGKTTLILQVLKKMNLSIKECIYISCDHPLFIDIDLFEFLKIFSLKGGKVIFIDEIHKIKNFQKHLKSAYDFLDLKIVFSGSSSLSITNPDFTRRFSMYRLPFLSLKEYIELYYNISLKTYSLKDIIYNHEEIVIQIINDIKPEKILKLFDEYNEHGAYPFYIEDSDKFIDRLNDTINAILYYDLAEIFSINSDKLQTLKKLLLIICVYKPLELSVEKITRITGISKATLYKYIEYLSKAELILHIPHEAKRFKAIRKPDKLYLASTNLFKPLCLNYDTGTLRETFFASILNYNYNLYYLDKGDFLIDEKYIFEIGGKNKDFSQIKDLENSFIAVDDIEIGYERKIPLWLFGFLY